MILRFLTIGADRFKGGGSVGDELTLADIQCGHILFRYYDIGIRRADLPNVQAYYKRLAERAAFRKHVMLSYTELKVD
ncbi:glutathione binding-like protein [Tateyamaria sp. Alg231-49]|uniref:glutathione binding-like protein n=1 Tax=Tateyamaria sp. Alg231-49 TaxID=1922219 RepID=UPI000D55677F|nr:glutathione binding-like protein [Tateyamaria sp. Alg231-49]